MRIALGIQVLFCGVSLPAKYLERNWLSLLTLLGGVMTIAWFICALLIWGLIPNLTYLESLCLSAAITPTDPVLSNGIASFAHEQLGNIIIAEGGANDGLGFPYLYLPVYLMRRRPDGPDAGLSIGSEVGRWIYSTLVYQILLSTAYGFTVGFVARKTLKWAERRDWVEKNNFFVYSFGLAFFCLGTCGMIGSDDILSCFIAGNSFTHDDWFRLRTLENDTQEILDLLLNLIVFIYAGAIIPFDSYSSENKLEPWRVIVLAICGTFFFLVALAYRALTRQQFCLFVVCPGSRFCTAGFRQLVHSKTLRSAAGLAQSASRLFTTLRSRCVSYQRAGRACGKYTDPWFCLWCSVALWYTASRSR